MDAGVVEAASDLVTDQVRSVDACVQTEVFFIFENAHLSRNQLVFFLVI